MKTLIKSLALALSLSVVTSAASFVEAKPIVRPGTVASYQTSMYTTGSGKLSIALDKQTGGTVDIHLKNASGEVIYSQHLKKSESKFRAHLDMSELADGVYQVEITNGVDTTTHNVTISTQQPEVQTRLVAVR